MNTERLEYLITLMERVEQKNKAFDMSGWGRTHNESAEPTMCNTVCCALGTAALDPKCIADGLKLIAAWYDDSRIQKVTLDLTTDEAWKQFTEKEKDIYGQIAIYPVYQGYSSFSAGAMYYEISDEASNYIFDPGEYRLDGSPGTNITPAHVIEHIREVLNGDIN